MASFGDTVKYVTHSGGERDAFILQLPEVPAEHTDEDKQFLAMAAKHGYTPAAKPAAQFSLSEGQAVLGVVETTPRLRVYLRVSEPGEDGETWRKVSPYHGASYAHSSDPMD